MGKYRLISWYYKLVTKRLLWIALQTNTLMLGCIVIPIAAVLLLVASIIIICVSLVMGLLEAILVILHDLTKVPSFNHGATLLHTTIHRIIGYIEDDTKKQGN